ncbi:putative RNA-binding Zn ribbon-like protein [Phyllobacterium myrsinacearum]|uniref:CGNR zinc finger domain-containing protein n=1 Tax=Phyllobacterium myrsinacearum TaxID=28101 RepID=UPI0010291C74|nr:CGNR zinc finger domain-containing protein [Phyllobacterium myrsinacearum]RZS83264.1 putative RNA-binding Zn ribbon-like protein [Phyllobacterium myrsinacearum]
MPFIFLGNALWLDFVNTQIIDGEFIDLIGRDGAFLQWAKTADLQADPADAATFNAALTEAQAFRAQLRAAADGLAAGTALNPAFIADINRRMAEHPVATVLETSESGWATSAKPVTTGPQSVLAEIASDFARFVTDEATNVRHCSNERCCIVFYDTSKNHTRRWCSMETCGNRAKAAGRRARIAR